MLKLNTNFITNPHQYPRTLSLTFGPTSKET